MRYSRRVGKGDVFWSCGVFRGLLGRRCGLSRLVHDVGYQQAETWKGLLSRPSKQRWEGLEMQGLVAGESRSTWSFVIQAEDNRFSWASVKSERRVDMGVEGLPQSLVRNLYLELFGLARRRLEITQISWGGDPWECWECEDLPVGGRNRAAGEWRTAGELRNGVCLVVCELCLALGCKEVTLVKEFCYMYNICILLGNNLCF